MDAVLLMLRIGLVLLRSMFGPDRFIFLTTLKQLNGQVLSYSCFLGCSWEIWTLRFEFLLLKNHRPLHLRWSSAVRHSLPNGKREILIGRKIKITSFRISRLIIQKSHEEDLKIAWWKRAHVKTLTHEKKPPGANKRDFATKIKNYLFVSINFKI